jgi:hypothetical protein
VPGNAAGKVLLHRELSWSVLNGTYYNAKMAVFAKIGAAKQSVLDVIWKLHVFTGE